MKSFSRVRLFVILWTAAHQAPQSMGFSRQEYWSGLPFPSPMHESEKWKWSRSVVSHSSWSCGLQPTRLLRPWDFPGKSTGVGCHCLLLTLVQTLCCYLCSCSSFPWEIPWKARTVNFYFEFSLSIFGCHTKLSTLHKAGFYLNIYFPWWLRG